MGKIKETQLEYEFFRELSQKERDERMFAEMRLNARNQKPFKPFTFYKPKLTKKEINNAPIWSDFNPDKEQY